MVKWVKTMMVVSALAMFLGTPAWADVSSQGGDIGSIGLLQTAVCGPPVAGGVAVQCVNLLGAGTNIKGFKLIAGAANSRCALYDATTTPSAANHRVGLIDEIYESSADETNLHIWPSPITLTNGLSVNVIGTGSIVIIYY